MQSRPAAEQTVSENPIAGASVKPGKQNGP